MIEKMKIEGFMGKAIEDLTKDEMILCIDKLWEELIELKGCNKPKTNKMKIELIKQIDERGDTWYFTRKNGVNVSGSWSSVYETALSHYNRIANKGITPPTEEVLKTTEI